MLFIIISFIINHGKEQGMTEKSIKDELFPLYNTQIRRLRNVA